MNSSGLTPATLGRLRQSGVISFEEVQCESAMNAQLEQPLVEGHGQDRGPPVPCDEHETSFLRVLEKLAGTLPEVARAEKADGTHGSCPPYLYP